MSAKSSAVEARADRSSRTGEWFTPRRVLDAVDAYYGGRIPYDPYTAYSNPTRALQYSTREDDGNAVGWGVYGGVFCNPPYGVKNGMLECVDKIAEEARVGTEILCLVSAARFETRRGQTNILNGNLKTARLKKRNGL